MSITSKLIQHSDISNSLLEDVANLKAIRWSYSLDKQLDWMKNNLMPNDFHLIVYLNNDLIAYTNFVDIEVGINEELINFRGIGNVCTSESGKGYGDILMNEVNSAILKSNWNGILLCKDTLVSYYEKYNWVLVSKKTINSEKLNEINTMILNFDKNIASLKYNDRNF